MLIPNGSFHDIPLIKEAKKQGYYVITSGVAPGGLGHKYADEYIYADFSNPKAMLQIAKEKNIDNICSNCNDFGYLSACYVAENLGLGGHEFYENALKLHHKDKFKKLSKELNLHSPVAEGFDDERLANEWIMDVEYPIIVKPVDLGAGQGIKRCDEIAEAREAIADAFNKSKCNRIVIEPFIEGTSHSFNAFIVNKKVASYYSDNEYMRYTPYRVSTSVGPADRIDEYVDILISDTEKVAKALNLPDGLMHLQYILDKNIKPHIIEITRRMSGDWYPYPEMKATGIDWISYIVKAQCGNDCSDFPVGVKQKGVTGRHCLNARKQSRVNEIIIKSGLKEYVYDSIFWIENGYEITNIYKDYPGIIFFEYDDKIKIMNILEHIEDYYAFS
ncbi:MAG: ATP-grasp domain-containing protein [Lachnospiraceae bacterium]|nr:ATP-grasp domain-containing protein [Lachnospiraceae bacterium]